MMIDIDTLLAWGATYRKVKAGEIIFKEGDHLLFYYQLVSGKLLWVNINEEGKEFIQFIVDPGECFGELPLFDGMPYAATAVAVEDAVVIRLHQSSFQQLLKENFEIHFAFSKLLTQMLRFKFLVLKEMACHDPEQRILALLNYFRETHKNICSKCNQLQLTRKQIADMTGLRVETVIRVIRHLQEKGELVINKGKIFYDEVV
jgi:CRP/FNR family cyclic AMP-dependent transcriptional regulator